MSIGIENLKLILKNYLTISFFTSVLSLIAIILIIYAVFKLLIKWINRITAKTLSITMQTIIAKILRYTCMIVIILTIFKHIGVNINALVGAAGIAGVAIGFASQTSVSNIISGFFVLAEKAFKIGDRIQLGDVVGNVEAIEFMAIKVKTLDGNIVRIPNEVVIKGNLINFSSIPIRRIETAVSVAYKSDLAKVEKLLMEIPAMVPQILCEPSPFVLWSSYAQSGINVSLYVWGKNEDFLEIKNTVFKLVNQLFTEADITIPFPQMDIHIQNEKG